MPRTTPTAAVVALLAVLLGAGAARPAAADDPPPELTIPRLDGSAVHVDGVLDEPVWAETSLVVDTWWNYDPVDEGRSAIPTEVRMFHDERAIYFGWRCTLPAGDRVRAHLAAREDVDRDDQVGIYLDTFDDDRRGYVFYTNALGQQQDIRAGDDIGFSKEWDTRYQSAGRLTADGYVVEIAIPFASLRFPRGEEHRFGLVLTRRVSQRNAKIVFPEVERAGSIFAQAATLVGIRGAVPGRPIEIIPSVVFGHGWARDDGGAMVADRALGFDSLHQGATFRFGLTRGRTLFLKAQVLFRP